jgi:hypothetical protein
MNSEQAKTLKLFKQIKSCLTTKPGKKRPTKHQEQNIVQIIEEGQNERHYHY